MCYKPALSLNLRVLMDIFFSVSSIYPRPEWFSYKVKEDRPQVATTGLPFVLQEGSLREQVEYTAVRKKVVTFVLQTRIVLESQSTHGHIFFCLKYIPKTQSGFPTLD